MIKTLTAIAIAGAAIASSMPIATAQPGCTASGLSSALGQGRHLHRGLAERPPRGRGGGQHGRRERHPHLLRHPPGGMV